MMRIILLTTATLIAAASFSTAEHPTEAKVSCRDKFVCFSKNTNVYSGEAELYFRSVPENFNGYKITLRSLCSAKPVKFKVKEAGIIRIAVAGLPVRTLLSEGWTEIDRLQLLSPEGVIGGTVLILEKQFDVGNYSIPSEGNFGIRLLKK